MAALASLRTVTDGAVLVPVNTSVEYLRPAIEGRVTASARIIRAGRRLANLHAMLWQESEDKPVATAVINVAIT
jgi:uncharacterized protein (TIGR00369 family)